MLLAAVLLSACKKNTVSNATSSSAIPMNSYTITGTVDGMANGTLMVLSNLALNSPLDSSVVKSGKVSFSGKVEHDPFEAIIRVYDSVGAQRIINYNTFYLENAEYTFSTTNNDFNKAQLQGSKINDISNDLNSKLAPFKKLTDSIRQLSWNPNPKMTKEEREANFKMASNAFNEIRKIDSTFLFTQTNTFQALDIMEDLVFNFAASKKQGASPVNSAYSETQLKDLYNNLTPAFKETEKAKAIYAQLFETVIEEGMPYAELQETTTLEGKPFRIADLNTEYVLLGFTGVHCPPCKKFKKEFTPHYDQFKDKMTIVYFHTDTDKKLVADYVAKMPVSGITVSDFKGPGGVNTKRYNITGIPDFYLLDKDRNVLKHFYGYDENVKNYLMKLLNITKS